MREVERRSRVAGLHIALPAPATQPAPQNENGPAEAGPFVAAGRQNRPRQDGSVVALGQVVVGDHFGRGPFQGFAFLALALGLLDPSM